MPNPRVSILIPNYNNGIESSKGKRYDLLGMLLESLHGSLKGDPTPLEIIAFDDGSTDDSLATLRTWSKKTWRGGQPFLKLMEAEHCGILSITANKLVRASRGEILVRLDGDVQCLTEHWAAKLCQVFDDGPKRLGVVGPKQLGSDGKIHAFGDFVLHPKGYHHVGQGLERYAFTRPMEVDHVMGCFYCCKRAVYDEVGGFDEKMLRGQTIDFGMAARLKGWSCIAVPHIEFAHHHGMREDRPTKADTDDGVDQTVAYFREKWGFCRIAADLEVVAQKYAGTPLLWNAAVFGMALDERPTPWPQPNGLEHTLWARYAQDAVTRQQINLRVQAALETIGQVTPPPPDGQPTVAVLGCGVGLIPHLLATQGVRVVATEENPHEAALAQQIIESQSYASKGAKPTVYHQADRRQVPLDDASIDVVVISDVIQRHRNPTRLLAEAGRILRGDGRLLVITRQHPPYLPSATEAEHPYHLPELLGQVMRASGCKVINDPRPRSAEYPYIAVAQPIVYARARKEPEAEKTAA